MIGSNSLFYNYGINRVDRISIPANVSQELRRKMLKLYVPNRLRAKILWNLIQYSDPIAGFLRFKHQTIGPSLRLNHFDWVRWMIQINKKLGEEKLIPAFYFPPQGHRKKFSVLIFNATGTPVAFAKIAWGDEEIEQTQREKEGYLFCNSHKFQYFETPTILLSDVFEGRHYNLLSPIPSDISFPPFNWSRVYQLAWEELSFSNRQRNQLRNLSWWNERKNWTPFWGDIYEFLEREEPEAGYHFCPAHGDFSLWNARVRSNRLYLFDWENFETEAPLFLDPLYYIIYREVLLQKVKNSKTIMNAMRSEFNSISSIQLSLPEVLLAFIYLRIYNKEGKFCEMLEELAFNQILNHR